MTEILTIEGDTADLICHRAFGRTRGITEQLLIANPGLADRGPVLPGGIKIKLPELPADSDKQTINLWD